MSKNYDNLITLEHHKELSLLLGYEEMRRMTEGIPKFNLDKFLDFDLEEIYMYCAVNCIENPYIANYIKRQNKYKLPSIVPNAPRGGHTALLFVLLA